MRRVQKIATALHRQERFSEWSADDTAVRCGSILSVKSLVGDDAQWHLETAPVHLSTRPGTIGQTAQQHWPNSPLYPFLANAADIGQEKARVWPKG